MFSLSPRRRRCLTDALRRLPGVSILDPSRDLVGITAEEIKGYDLWPSWVVKDLDGDGRQDVVVTVVKRVAQGTQYGVFAVHAAAPQTIHWVIEMQKQRLDGVGVSKDGKVTPLFCIRCDGNAWFRWSGQSYQAELFAVGETIAVGTPDEQEPLSLFAQPSRGSQTLRRLRNCTKGKVLRISGSTYQTRWYLVELLSPKGIRGWVPASKVTDETCLFI